MWIRGYLSVVKGEPPVIGSQIHVLVLVTNAGEVAKKVDERGGGSQAVDCTDTYSGRIQPRSIIQPHVLHPTLGSACIDHTSTINININ